MAPTGFAIEWQIVDSRARARLGTTNRKLYQLRFLVVRLNSKHKHEQRTETPLKIQIRTKYYFSE